MPTAQPAPWPPPVVNSPPPPTIGALQPPRPRTKVAGWSMFLGGAAMVIGVALPWISAGATSFNGVDDWQVGFFRGEASTSSTMAALGVILVGFGVATMAAGRPLPIMIIGIVVGGLALWGAIDVLAFLTDVTDYPGVDLGPGVPLAAVGSVVALAGAIAGCATRRRWRGGTEPPSMPATSKRA